MPRIFVPAMSVALHSSAFLSAEAFTSVASISVPLTNQLVFSSTARMALIYGWDGDDDQEYTTTGSSSYLDVGSELSGESCSPVGTAVAESLSFDSNRAGHLARLAVAFSPPDRALALDRIERVDVLCVRDDHIEIEAIICEDGGCVSLAVPVKFPRDCQPHHGASGALEGCVMQNLDELDVQAGSLLKVADDASQTNAYNSQYFDELSVLNDPIQTLPDWWVPPSTAGGYGASGYMTGTLTNDVASEGEKIKSLLNDAEFQSDVKALVMDQLRRLEDGDYRVLQAKVGLVGPAGMCFKARVEMEDQSVKILDVAYPFGSTMSTADELRAAVLGAVSSADGS